MNGCVGSATCVAGSTSHSGMCKTLLTLDPLDDAKVWTAFNAAVATARAVNQDNDDRTWDQLQADAIVDHLTRQSQRRWSGGARGRGVGAHRLPGVRPRR